MKPYPLVEELLGPVLRVAVPRALGSAAFLTRYLPLAGDEAVSGTSQELMGG